MLAPENFSATISSEIRRRQGFVTGTPETLETVATYFSVTRERIRQIEVGAMRKLKVYFGANGDDS